MNFTYHVFFSPKSGFSESEVIGIISQFADNEIKENFMDSYSLIKFDNKASFSELDDYHFSANYKSLEDRQKASKAMSKAYTKEPHLSMMKMTENFKVAFSQELLAENRNSLLCG